MRVLAGLRVDRDDVGASGEEIPDQPIYRFHHQVDIDGRVHPTPVQRLEHQRADAQVRHVMVVHHVEMDQVGARGNHVVDFLTEFGEVRRENGRRDPAIHGFDRSGAQGRAFYSVRRRTRLSWSGVPMSIHVPLNSSPSRSPAAAASNSSLVSENAPSGAASNNAGLSTAMPQ